MKIRFVLLVLLFSCGLYGIENLETHVKVVTSVDATSNVITVNNKEVYHVSNQDIAFINDSVLSLPAVGDQIFFLPHYYPASGTEQEEGNLVIYFFLGGTEKILYLWNDPNSPYLSCVSAVPSPSLPNFFVCELSDGSKWLVNGEFSQGESVIVSFSFLGWEMINLSATIPISLQGARAITGYIASHAIPIES